MIMVRLQRETDRGQMVTAPSRRAAGKELIGLLQAAIRCLSLSLFSLSQEHMHTHSREK
jgi:hypothetical protein